ncbi:MAG: hypothetical protein AAFZ52_05265 [Bacteroidota bacterium]
MEDGKQYLDEGADAAERAAAAAVLAGLEELRLEETVRRAAARRRVLRRRWFWAVVGIVACGVTAWWWAGRSDANPVDPSPAKGPVIDADTVIYAYGARPEDSVALDSTDQPRVQWKRSLEARQALVRQLWPNTYPLTGLDASEVFPVVDSLLRDGRFPAASLELRRRAQRTGWTDTLHYLQGYALLQLGRAPAAVASLNEMSPGQPAWSAQRDWLLAGGLLLAGRDGDAAVLLSRMAKEVDHPYGPAARRALSRINF